MKIRIIDIEHTAAIHNTDDTWLVYANKLFEAFGEITRRNNFMPEDFKRLYVGQRARPLDEELLKSLVFSVPPAFVKPDIILPLATAAKEGTTELKAHWAASESAPFILLGYIGIGKSTYLEHFFLEEVKAIDPSIEGIILDFKQAPSTPDAFKEYLLDQIDKELIQLDPNVNGRSAQSVALLFKEEFALIDSQFRSPGAAQQAKEILLAGTLLKAWQKDASAMTDMISRQLRHLRSKGKTIWLALDNIDQHFYILHHSAFVEAIAVAYKLECRLIISMRYLSLQSVAARHVYDSYVPRKLKLSLPNVSELLARRLEYFKSENKAFMKEALAWTGNQLKVQDLAADIETCIQLMSQSEFLYAFLLPLVNYNLRKLLQILLSCFQSYYFFFDRFNNWRYVPNAFTLRKRFLYAHLLKNADYFDPHPKDMQERCIINMFDNESKDSKSNHTIRIRLLQYLNGKTSRVSLKELTADIQAVFDYATEDIASALHVFITCELVSISNIGNFGFDTSIFHERLSAKHLGRDDVEVAISFCGRMHFDLMHSLFYVEIMKFSTYVDDKIYVIIQGEDYQRTMNIRFRGSVMFLDYLAKQEREETEKSVKKPDVFKDSYGAVVPTIIRAVKEHFEAIQQYDGNAV